MRTTHPGVVDPETCGGFMPHPGGVPEFSVASTYLALNVHIVFATKGRAPMIAPDWRPDLHAYIGGTIRGLGAVPTIVGGVADHVHFLAGLRGTHAVADLVREVKKASHGWARERFAGFQWQEGYGAFSVSPLDVPKVVAYIANQEEHHRRVSSARPIRAIRHTSLYVVRVRSRRGRVRWGRMAHRGLTRPRSNP